MQIPEIKKSNRDREYYSFSERLRDTVVYNYLFLGMSHRQLDNEVLNLSSSQSRGYMSMNILHYLGIKSPFKGIFSNITLEDAINLLNEEGEEYFPIVLCLQRYNNYLNLENNRNDALKKIDARLKTEFEEIELIDFKNLTLEEKDAFIKTMITHRNGYIQRIFRKNLLTEFNCKCALCGINKEELLLASHIVAYSKCSSKEEMIDNNNGLLLCPNHDALFDGKLISFSEDGKIIISNYIPKEIYDMLNISSDMKIDTKYLSNERKKYLSMHRSELKNK